MPGKYFVRDLERIFKGLADQTRLRILNLLLQGELCVCDVQYVLESSQPNVSRHLTYLRNSGLVSDRREGARIYYRLVEHKQLLAFLREAFNSSDELAQDLRKLKKAVQSGSCTISQARPLVTISSKKASLAKA